MSVCNEIWNTIVDHCLIPIKDDLHFIDLINYIWMHDTIYNKIYHRPLEKFFVLSGPYGRTGIMLYLEILS